MAAMAIGCQRRGAAKMQKKDLLSNTVMVVVNICFQLESVESIEFTC